MRLRKTENWICHPAWLHLGWHHCCCYSSQSLIRMAGLDNKVVIWKIFGGPLTMWSFVMQQVLCLEQLRWLVKAQLSVLCRNHRSRNVAIPSSDWMQWEKLYGICLLWFLVFSFFLFYYLWLLEWKGFWVIKNSFLFWQANIWSYFSGLLHFFYLLLPSSCMSVRNENAHEKLKCFISA